MKRPDYLKKGDLVGLVAPAKRIFPHEMEMFHQVMRDWGLFVLENPDLYSNYFQFAGTDKERAASMQKMMDHPEVKAIFCARGGYGTNRILPLLDFKKFKSHPKWIIGYSDVTLLHAVCQNNLGVESIHAIMPFTYGAKNESTLDSIESLRKALFGESLEYKVKYRAGSPPAKVTGTLSGGNLSVLYSLLGTSLQSRIKNQVLFVEDIDEYLYHIDRMMLALHQSGTLKELRGLIAGHFTDIHDNEDPFGYSIHEIITHAASGYGFPVLHDFPAGHEVPNLAMIMGREVTLDINEEHYILRFHQSKE